jgi:hypothetical protein
MQEVSGSIPLGSTNSFYLTAVRFAHASDGAGESPGRSRGLVSP